MTTKKLETLGGAFVSFSRSALEVAKRSELQSYLEQRGFAVYASESIRELREAALEDFDSETSAS